MQRHGVGIARRPNTRVAQRPLPGALGSGFGKNRSDDETKALASYLIAWDNVSKVSDEAADLLSRLVTGDMIEKRRLYTDAELATIVYRRTGVITGISVPRGVKADTLDRLILLALAPLGERVSENARLAGLDADTVGFGHGDPVLSGGSRRLKVIADPSD